jgi:hypothetical protein
LQGTWTTWSDVPAEKAVGIYRQKATEASDKVLTDAVPQSHTE